MIRPLVALALAALPLPAPAEGLSIRLNALEAAGDACRLSFVIANTLPTAIGAAVLEAVVLDPAGRVARMARLDLGALPKGRERVRSFDLPGLPCTDVGALLLTGFSACDGPDAGACDRALVAGSDVAGVGVRR